VGESGEAQASPPALERIDFTLERGRRRRFVGREGVLARLDEWSLGPHDTGWVVVIGGPGMGWSASLSKWLDRREATGAAVPHHFVPAPGDRLGSARADRGDVPRTARRPGEAPTSPLRPQETRT
jgi:hypothetical protein